MAGALIITGFIFSAIKAILFFVILYFVIKKAIVDANREINNIQSDIKQDLN